MTEDAIAEPTPEQAALFARVRPMMLIAGLTTAVAVGAVLIAIGYRLSRAEGSVTTAASEITATLPKGARIVSTAGARDPPGGALGIWGAAPNPPLCAQDPETAGETKIFSG